MGRPSPLLPGFVAVLVSLPPVAAAAWPTADCLASSFHVHGDIAAHVVDHATIAPLLAPLGLTRDGIIAAAAKEPTCSMDHHPGWSELASQDHLAWPVSDDTVGAILHVGGDSGVPCDHCPGCEVFVDTGLGQPGESVIEGAAELTSVPALTELYTGTYDAQMAAFHADEVALATAYKAFWEDSSHYCPLCNTSPYATTGMATGQKLAYAALLVYLTAHAPPPSDAGTDDAGADAAQGDAGAEDAGPDAARDDAGPPLDAAPPADAGPTDAPPPDAPADGGPGTAPGGCGCATAAAPPGLGLALALVAIARRLRVRSSSGSSRCC